MVSFRGTTSRTARGRGNVLANPGIEWPCHHAEQTYNAIRRVSVEMIGGMGESCSPNRDRPDLFSSAVDVKLQVSPRSRREHLDSRSTALAVAMMDNDLDLRDFANVTRLFPLPNLVMFPHVVLPLHIFEPRYRQMTEDALAGDRLITIVQITPPARGEHWTEPVPLESVGCLGKIIQHERLADGRFNLLLLGRKRVRLLREIATEKLYRIAEVNILQDQPAALPEGLARAELIGLFRRFFESQRKLDPDLAEFLNKPVPLGLLADIITHALDLPPALKQRLLAESSVDRRVDTIRSVLRQVTPGEGRHRPFPPPFSVN